MGLLDKLSRRKVDRTPPGRVVLDEVAFEVRNSQVEAVRLERSGGYWYADRVPVLTDCDVELARRVVDNLQRNLVGAMAVVRALEMLQSLDEDES